MSQTEITWSLYLYNVKGENEKESTTEKEFYIVLCFLCYWLEIY